MRSIIQNKYWQDSLLILGVTVLGLLFLVSNPGYYNHDELQRLDYLERYGFLKYISDQVVLTRGDHFGVPVRPIPFLIQGVLAFAMRDFPSIVHLFDVLTHGIVAVLIYFVLLRFGFSRVFRLVSACIFAINPMTVIAVGWSAALMDRWYVLFGIGAFLLVDDYLRKRAGIISLALAFILVLASVMSKETAITLPAVMLIFVFCDSSVLRNRRYWYACIAFVLPIVAYLIYRLPSISNSFGASAAGPYAASHSNIFQGLLVYFAYPFLFKLTEAGNWIFVSKAALSLAAAVHIALILALGAIKGWRLAFGYVFFYVIFLIPVLFIPSKGSHYLYASSIFFSVAIAWLIIMPEARYYKVRWFGVFSLILIMIHTVVLELFVYQLGTCMDKAMTSLESVHLSLGRPSNVEIRGEPGAPIHILHRFTTGRDQIGDSYPVKMTVVDLDAPKLGETQTILMNRQCRVYILSK